MKKQSALARLDSRAILAIAEEEAALVGRLREHVQRGPSPRNPLSEHLRRDAFAIRRHLAANWLLAHKLNEFVSRTLTCLATAARPTASEPYQGLVIDQTV